MLDILTTTPEHRYTSNIHNWLFASTTIAYYRDNAKLEQVHLVGNPVTWIGGIAIWCFGVVLLVILKAREVRGWAAETEIGKVKDSKVMHRFKSLSAICTIEICKLLLNFKTSVSVYLFFTGVVIRTKVTVFHSSEFSTNHEIHTVGSLIRPYIYLYFLIKDYYKSTRAVLGDFFCH